MNRLIQTRPVWWAAVWLAAAVGCAAPSKPLPKPEPLADPPSKEEIKKSLRRGAAFLVRDQNANGSWGSATRTKGLNIFAPIPGSHHAFRTAVTALCVSALIETGDLTPAAESALASGEQWLLKNVSRVRRANMTALYNVWSHAYSIQALVRMLGRASDESARQKIRSLILDQIDRLQRYEFVGGGWGYYDFHHHTRRPGGDPTSFTTATVLVALHEAEQAGVAVPEKLVQRGLREIRRQRKPNQTYLYSRNFKFHPMRSINRPGGSLGRSQACNAALRLWDDPVITDRVLAIWLDRLFARQGWLDIGRKRPVPHESWFAVAGYFYYYGHYYAAYCLEQLPAEKRGAYQDHLGRLMIRRQEKDGSWWDYPLYDYHQPYGTAFAMMSLVRCRK
ncbi:MAG: hypothetical protein R3236_02990 [Phycisphaeraceae bacterium]|nr:hypothetical protein [Phycisphaeraceae bacterium]